MLCTHIKYNQKIVRACYMIIVNHLKMVEDFTDRENEVAGLLSAGLSEKEIAAKIFVTVDTVHTHTRNMRKKIGARCAVDIVRKFILSLEDPKRYFAALGFLVIHIILITTGLVIDARAIKTPRISRMEIEMISTRGRFTRNRKLC